ncbi:MAG TPA: nuclear transport factor 2 family protein [Pseudoxanthomonas sp.]|nr:nuclear transport factor 2 family protein [Pseudoxanthomonas sp.]
MDKLLAVLCLACAAPAFAAPADVSKDASLEATITALDGAVFDAFNHCSDPTQLRRHAEFFAPDVEFYHDTGGVTWTREAMIANTAKYACGHYTRERVSLQVSPIKDFGAIAQGVHRFCQTDTGRCDGEADFAMVWRLREGQWQITRVLSYGHRSSADTVRHDPK